MKSWDAMSASGRKRTLIALPLNVRFRRKQTLSLCGKKGSDLATGDFRFAPILYYSINGQSLAKISPRLSVERSAYGPDRLPDLPSLSTARIRRSQRSTIYPGDRSTGHLYPDLSDNVSLCFRRHLQRIAETATGEKETPQVILFGGCN